MAFIFETNRFQLRNWSMAIALALPAFAANAQQADSGDKSEKPKAEPNEQAKRLADSPFKWIIINGQKDAAQKSGKPQPAAQSKAKGGSPAAAVSSPPAPATAPRASRATAEAAPEPARARSNAEVTRPTDSHGPALPAPSATAGRAPEPPANKTAKAADVAPRPAPAPEPQETQTASSELKLIKQVLPEPPTKAYSEDKDDTIVVRFIVRRDGSVIDARIHESTNSKINPYVVRAVSEWQFAPIDSATEIEMNFVFNRLPPAAKPEAK